MGISSSKAVHQEEGRNAILYHPTSINQYSYGPSNRKLILFYETTIKNAETIISSQKILPNAVDPLFGDVIKFTEKINKTNNHKVFLVAEVNSPKTYLLNINLNQIDHIDNEYLKENGFTAVIDTRNNYQTFVLDYKIVKNIKYAYGFRPHATFSLKQDKKILLYATNNQNAKNIVENKKMEMIDGPFGLGCYMFDSITDSLAFMPNSDSYIIAEVLMDKCFKLREKVDVNSDNFRKFKVFECNSGLLTYYVITDLSLIKNIKIC